MLYRSVSKTSLAILTSILFFSAFVACNSNSASTEFNSADSVLIARGEALFEQHCAGCHQFKQDGIGPGLGTLTQHQTPDWIKAFIRDPKKMMASAGDHARDLSSRYKMIMPSFASLAETELDGLVAFIHAKRLPANTVIDTSVGITNPVPAPIISSGLVTGIELVTQFPVSAANGTMPATKITKLAVEPGSGNIFIVDLRGKLYKMEHNKPVVYMDMAKLRPRFVHEPRVATGFGSFAFHPDFSVNGLLYTTHAESANAAKADFGYADSIKVALQWVLTEWKVSNPSAGTFAGTSRELLRVNMVTAMHGIQEIAFNPLAKPGQPDYGMLYIGVGDGFSVEEGYPFLANGPATIWGTVIRIDPSGNNSANRRYGIPATNPFVIKEQTETLKEVYAYGFRNPHRLTWLNTGELMVTNVGQANIESINLVAPGQNFGWPYREGAFVVNPYGDLNKIYPLPQDDTAFHFTYPVIEYDHDEGIAIAGGYEYTGNEVPALKGKFLLGDIASGRLFYVETAGIRQGKIAAIKEFFLSINGKQVTLAALCKHDRVDLHFGRDAKGEIYLLTKTDGKAYKLINAGS